MNKVSVLLPVYNGEDYIAEAIDSILNQSYSDFDLVIIDDASIDETVSIIENYNDNRIRLVRNSENLKLAGTLNKGIDLIESEYIIRMDADDISLSHRIQILINFMDTHPEVDICSSFVEGFGNGKEEIMKYPSRDEEIKCEMLFCSPIAHAASIWRQSTIKKHNLKFDEKIRLAQDYDFWHRASQHVRFQNLPEVLYKYRRINIDKHYTGQQEVAEQIRNRQILNLGFQANVEELKLHNQIALGLFYREKAFLRKCDQWFSKLRKANEITSTYPIREFNQMLEERWFVIRAHVIERRFFKHLAMYKSSLFDWRYKVSYTKSLKIS